MEQRPLTNPLPAKHLLTALHFLKYLTLFESCGGPWPPFAMEPPAQNPWGFARDEKRLSEILQHGFDLEEDDPMGVHMGPYVGRMPDYYTQHLAKLHAFLEHNAAHGLLALDLQIDAFLYHDTESHSGDDAESPKGTRGEVDLSDGDRLRRFVRLLASGELTLTDPAP